MRMSHLAGISLVIGGFLTSASVFTAVDASDASKGCLVKVINENKKPLTVKIIPEDADADKVFEIKVSAERETSFTVTADQLGGKNYFSIDGDTSNPFTPSSKCTHLDVAENYHVTFQNDKIGTTCLSKVLDKKDAEAMKH